MLMQVHDLMTHLHRHSDSKCNDAVFFVAMYKYFVSDWLAAALTVVLEISSQLFIQK